MRLKKQISFLSFLVLGFVPFSVHVAAQQTSISVESASADRITYTLTADWETSLKAAIDSSGSQRLTPSSMTAASGGVLDVSQLVYLPSLNTPGVRIVASDYDEIVLPAADADSH